MHGIPVGAGTEGPARGRGTVVERPPHRFRQFYVRRLTKLDETADGREVRSAVAVTATAGLPPPLSGDYNNAKLTI